MKGWFCIYWVKSKQNYLRPILPLQQEAFPEAITFITNHFDHVYKNLTIDGILKMGVEHAKSANNDI